MEGLLRNYLWWHKTDVFLLISSQWICFSCTFCIILIDNFMLALSLNKKLIHFTNYQVARKEMGVLERFCDILETCLWHGKPYNNVRSKAIVKFTHLSDVGLKTSQLTALWIWRGRLLLLVLRIYIFIYVLYIYTTQFYQFCAFEIYLMFNKFHSNHVYNRSVWGKK